jgi:hypothetical protein
MNYFTQHHNTPAMLCKIAVLFNDARVSIQVILLILEGAIN